MFNAQRALAGAALLALAACSSPTPTPSTSAPEPVTNTSTSTSATKPVTSTSGTDPAQEAARFATVVPAFEQYWSVINETYAAGGAAEPTKGMLETMTGDQLKYWVTAFAKFKAAENSYSGQNKVVYATTKSVALKPNDGTATVDFCVDMSQTKAVDVDGRPLKKEGMFQKGVAGLMWREGRWKVAGFLEGTSFVAGC